METKTYTMVVKNIAHLGALPAELYDVSAGRFQNASGWEVLDAERRHGNLLVTALKDTCQSRSRNRLNRVVYLVNADDEYQRLGAQKWFVFGYTRSCVEGFLKSFGIETSVFKTALITQTT